MSWSQSDLDAINAAISAGAKRVRFQTHEVEYHSISDLLRARDTIKAELETSAGGSDGSVMFAEYSGGY